MRHRTRRQGDKPHSSKRFQAGSYGELSHGATLGPRDDGVGRVNAERGAVVDPSWQGLKKRYSCHVCPYRWIAKVDLEPGWSAAVTIWKGSSASGEPPSFI